MTDLFEAMRKADPDFDKKRGELNRITDLGREIAEKYADKLDENDVMSVLLIAAVIGLSNAMLRESEEDEELPPEEKAKWIEITKAIANNDMGARLSVFQIAAETLFEADGAPALLRKLLPYFALVPYMPAEIKE